MSKRYLGGVITKSPVTPNVSSANGIWTMEQQAHYRYSNCWPRSPGAPAITSVTKGNANVAVAFSAPSCTGSNTLTSYIATSNTGVSATNSTSPITVTGLTNGSSYTFVVRGINSAGTGACSATSAVAIPSTVPNAPTIGTATGSGCTAAVVTFTGSTCSGGNTITGYTVTSTPGSYTNTGASSPITVSGLNSNCSYTFKVKAQNANGYSACSSASNSVTFSTVPGAPTGVSASATSSSAISVSFSAPACTGHLTIDSYQVVCTSSGSKTATGSSSPISVTGLSASTSYTFKVRAHNSKGYGCYSSTASATTQAPPYMCISVSGATVYTCGNYKVATFRGSGSFVVNSLGLSSGYGNHINYLVVGGGGGGGSYGCAPVFGGGGGGNVIECVSCLSSGGAVVTAKSYSVVVGAGGPVKTKGCNSSFCIASATAGGGAGGGGCPYLHGGTSGNGNAGGGGFANGGCCCAVVSGGGGGGKTSSGESTTGGINYKAGGAGGAGTAFNSIWNVTGNPTSGGGGGGGGFLVQCTGYSVCAKSKGFGCSGAGRGAIYWPQCTTRGGYRTATSGTSYSGSGGGGGTCKPLVLNGPGGSGGSGIVNIRWRFQ